MSPKGQLSLERDPKQAWADLHPERYPVRLNTASKQELLRVPGVGPTTASRILKARGSGKLRDLEAVGLKGMRLRKASRYVVAS